MLSVLNQMPQRHGPDAFFNFPGRSAAVSLHVSTLQSLFIMARICAFLWTPADYQGKTIINVHKLTEQTFSYSVQ